jgi:hypothetical protein
MIMLAGYDIQVVGTAKDGLKAVLPVAQGYP